MIRKINVQSKTFKKQYDKLTAEGYVVVKIEGPTYIFEKVNQPKTFKKETPAPKLSVEAKTKLRKKQRILSKTKKYE